MNLSSGYLSVFRKRRILMEGNKSIVSRALRLTFVIALAAQFLLVGATAAFAPGPKGAGAVYVMSNSADANSILIFRQAVDGSLHPAGEVLTGGVGSGGGLGSQGALTLSQDGHWLVAVNAGSNQVSVLGAFGPNLKLTDVAGSGGEHPISVTIHGDLVYVLNDGGSGNISGFKLDPRGRLHPLVGSMQYLSNGGSGAAPGPAQVSFSQNGRYLVVTEKATNLIDVFPVGKGGLAGAASSYPSAGVTPFGFAFNRLGTMIVSEATGGAANASTISSYAIRNGQLQTITAALPDNQTAACWIAVTRNGRLAYTTNFGSDSISSFYIAPSGKLTLLNERAGEPGTGSGPLDMAFNNNNHYLYSLNGGNHTVTAFKLSDKGNLVLVDSVPAPETAVGIAAH
jgi:6-phosphogluconolactonase